MSCMQRWHVIGMDAFLVRRRDAKVSYFQSPEFEDKRPDDQRWKDSGLPDRKIAKSIMPTSIRDASNQTHPRANI